MTKRKDLKSWEIMEKRTKQEGSGDIIDNTNNFFSFRILITNHVIVFVYCVGLILITVVSLLALIGALNNEIMNYQGYGFLGLIFGNLFWRLICELWIVFFGIHERLREIEKKLK